MGAFVWPSEDGWPYPDAEADLVDPTVAAGDDDLLCLQVSARRALSRLDPVERQVIAARFGLDGRGVRSFEQIQAATGVSPIQAADAMGSGLAKLRRSLA